MALYVTWLMLIEVSNIHSNGYLCVKQNVSLFCRVKGHVQLLLNCDTLNLLLKFGHKWIVYFNCLPDNGLQNNMIQDC